MLTTHKVLFKKTGENSTTPASPVRAFVEGQDEALLAVTETFCFSSDNDLLVKANLWEVHTVSLPEWMSVEEWCNNVIGWKYTWGCGVDPLWEKSWQTSLLRMSTIERLACVKLLKTKTFRSDFRKSLRDQLMVWLNTAADDRKYSTPFSQGQWDALCNVYAAREARQLDNNLYYNRHYCGAPTAQ